MLKQSRRVFRVPTLQQKRSYNGCVNPCVEYCISRSVYCRISSTGNRVIFELPLSKHNFITDGFTRFFGSISRTDSRNQSQSQSPKWETPDTIQSKEECKAWKILQGMKTSGKRGRNSQTERTDEKLRPTVISDNAQLMNELGGLERLGEVFNKIIWSVDVIRGLVAGDEGAIKNWRNITLNVVALRKLITKMVGQIGENDDENCGVIKRIFLDGISRQSSRLFSLLVDQIERLPLDLIREALLLSDMLDGHHSTYSRTPTTKNLSLPLTALSSGEISETTLSSLFRNAFIDRLSMNEVLDASTIRNVIQFTKQYANDVEQLTELNHIWIRMIQNLITPSCLLIDRNSARTDDFEIPTAHEVLAIIRFIARIVPTDRNFPPTNHLAAFCSNSVGRNSTTALDDILPCTDDKTPIHPIALQPHLNESKDRSHIDILSPLSVESMTRINALLGPNWRHILSALFLSPLWEFALPRQLAESLYLGWRLGTLSSTSIEFLTTRLADMEPLLGSNSPLHSPNIATSSSLPNSECRYLFLLLSMVKSSSIQTLGPAKTSCPNISGRLIKHLSQSATSNIPSSVSMSALIAFTTAVVRLGLRVPKLRRRLVVDMQRGKLMQLTPDLFLTALSHFQFLGIQRSDESHTFVVSYVKKKLPEFTPNQLLILLSLVPRHITRLDEAKSALLPPMRNLVRLFERFVGPPVNRLIQNCSSVNTPNSEHPASRDSASRDSASTDSASTDLELRDLELGDLEMREGFVHPFMKTISICDVVLAIDSLRPLAGRSMPLPAFQSFVASGLNMACLKGLQPTADDMFVSRPPKILNSLDIRLLTFSQLGRLLKDSVEWDWDGTATLISALYSSIISDPDVTQISYAEDENGHYLPRASTLSALSVLRVLRKLETRPTHSQQLVEHLIKFINSNYRYLAPQDARQFLQCVLHLHPAVLNLDSNFQNLGLILSISLSGANVKYRRQLLNDLSKVISHDRILTILTSQNSQLFSALEEFPPDLLYSNHLSRDPQTLLPDQSGCVVVDHKPE